MPDPTMQPNIAMLLAERDRQRAEVSPTKIVRSKTSILKLNCAVFRSVHKKKSYGV